MLNPEQAKAQLDQWKLPKEKERFSSEIETLSPTAREIGKAMWANDLGPYQYEERQKRHQEAIRKIDKISDNHRKELFTLLSPKLAPAIEAAWELLKTTPYQIGYSRKAFRVPARPGMTVSKRFTWLLLLGRLASEYPADLLTPKWLATWAAHLSGGYQAQIGILLAATLNDKQHPEAGEIFEILRESLNNRHEIGAMGRHVTTAFLLSDNEEGWELVEKTLLAAQRQEGLRQSILEAIDESHPGAFRRMLRLVLDEDLIRFAATVRAVDVWFDNMWAAGSNGVIKNMLTQVVEFLENPSSADKAIAGKDPQGAFLALWCKATVDAYDSISSAEKLLSHKSVEMRYVAAKHLRNLSLDTSSIPLIKAIEDEDLRVALLGVGTTGYSMDGDEEDGETTVREEDDRFEKLEKLLDRLPVKPEKLKPLVWPWTEIQVKRADVAYHLLPALGKRPAIRLLPHLEKMEGPGRWRAVRHMIDTKPWDAATRAAIVELAGDTSSDTRDAALNALKELVLDEQEVIQLEVYLARKAADLRRSILDLILKLPDAEALASTARLLAGKDANQRLAGLEILRLMADKKRSIQECRVQAAGYATGRKKISKEEQAHLDEIAKDKVAVATLDDALGLMNPADRSPVVPPKDRKPKYITAAAIACLQELDDLVQKHAETPIQFRDYAGALHEELLGNIRWGFPGPEWNKPRDKQLAKLPLADIWTQWFEKRGEHLKDPDGLEFVRAYLWAEFCADAWRASAWTESAKKSPWRKRLADQISGEQAPKTLRHGTVVKQIVEWVLFLHPVDPRDYLVDVAESISAQVPSEEIAKLASATPPKRGYAAYQITGEDTDWRDDTGIQMWVSNLESLAQLTGHPLTEQHRLRQWQWLHWLDEPTPGALRRRPSYGELLHAYGQQKATLADIADQLLGPRGSGGYSGETFDLLQQLTSRKRGKDYENFLSQHPEVQKLVDDAVERILQLELARGDASTAATAPAGSITALWRSATLHRVLRALGKAEFKVTASWRSNGEDRRSALTHLAKVCYPAPDEKHEDFVKLMKAAVKVGDFPEERLLQLTFLAPQWTKFIEAYFDWKYLDEGVYWFLAHMQSWGATENAALAGGEDDRNEEEENEATEEEPALEAGSDGDEATPKPPKPKKLSAWERLIIERTPLSVADRASGAVDAAWFRRVHELIGPKKWEAIATAARFAANAAQAKKAKHIGDVLIGKVKRQELIDGIKKKQLKEQVRLLGLLPLATGAKREIDLRERCQVLRDYRRYANTLSGLTKPDALRAWEIGLTNLAQTSGYSDPMRLEWSVGAEAVKDLAKGPVAVTKSGITVTLSLDEEAKPSIAVARGDKELKSIPPAIKKDKKIVELTGRVPEIKRQVSSIKRSLETAMCRGDTFLGTELRIWCEHALLVPFLSRLVIVGEGIMGYPDKGGKALRDFNGKFEPVKPKEVLRIAHPHDLFAGKAWHDWQKDCFRAERIQPFKQVFRELYIPTAAEKKETVSHRYDGQQVQPKQASALFGSRGWNTGEGIFKVFHNEELTVDVHFNYTAGTPGEVEGWTIGGISFRKRDDWKPLKLTAIPPRLFSEVMRDLDLVVSVAHAGGVDPEASASTVEMRLGLVRETCALMNLKNVKLKGSHAVVSGELGNYSIHLSSGTVHLMPGGHLCIIPVHAQQRGRLFLPFADDDPKTAEVVSKVLMLARDQEIQDPSILEQIRAKGA
jgi:hypothetical protein